MAEVHVLVVGGGGREHALTWALRKSGKVGRLSVAPGNAGTAGIAQNVNIPAEDVAELVDFALANGVNLVVVGPEVPLVAGLVDRLMAVGIPAFGCTQAAAQLEASKAFAKAFMQEYGIPTAAYATFTDYSEAAAYVDSVPFDVVVKADGLAAGKGVIVCDDKAQAHDALKLIMQDGAFGTAGGRVVVEERLTGREVSMLAFCDGRSVALMTPMRDHKRIYDNDEGPNTGGMGAFGPVDDLSADDLETIKHDVIQRAVDGMAARGIPYQGVLYAGLMLTPNGIKTLEFNCRFGDPETQAILPLLETDLFDVISACVNGKLNTVDVVWRKGACATIVASAPGYPGDYAKGLVITGLDAVQDSVVFHAGVAHDNTSDYVTSGGRVLAVSAVGDTLTDALDKAYTGISCIHFDGMHYRRDIGR